MPSPHTAYSQHQSKGLKYGGHSEHVTNVQFAFDDSRVVSTGGEDCAFVRAICPIPLTPLQHLCVADQVNGAWFDRCNARNGKEKKRAPVPLRG